MKQKVIEFLQNLPREKYDQFNEAFELYRKSEGKVFGVERAINAAGFSERALENLLYDLQKMHGITDVEKEIPSPSLPEGKGASAEDKKWNSLDPDTAEFFQMFLAIYPEDLERWAATTFISLSDIEKLLELSENAGITEVTVKLRLVIDYFKSSIQEGNEGVLLLNPNSEIEGKKEVTTSDDSHPGTAINDIDVNDNNVVNIDGKLGVDFGILKQENENLASENEDLQYEKDELEEENEVLKDEIETLKSLPKIDAKSIRIEFPFLNDKDCPDEFKILVSDKISAWNRYLSCQEEIQKINSGEESEHDLDKLAKSAIDHFDENQKIYDELNAYQTTGKVLGLHPIFKRLQLTREVEAMTSEELVKYKSASAKYFSDNRTSLAKAEKAKNTEKIELITNRVAEREVKLALVNKKLGINPK